MRKVMEWAKSHKPHTAVLAVAVFAAISLAVAAACGVLALCAADKAGGADHGAAYRRRYGGFRLGWGIHARNRSYRGRGS